MNAKNNSQAQALNEQSEVMTFNFSESKQPIRNLIVENKPWFIAKDVCDALGIKNNRQAIRDLDDDEKLTYKLYTSGQNRNTSIITESGLYALILRSKKPYAKTFRKWITSEVIPTILKKGFYLINSSKNKSNFIDARDVPYSTQEINSFNVRSITLKGTTWVSVNDCNQAIHSSTGSFQVAKKLNARQQLAIKIWLFGNTHPAWFTNELGVQLILSGSRKLRMFNQLNLAL